MLQQKVVSDVAPTANGDKICKRCNLKAVNAIITCVKCKEVYHKSCVHVLSNRGKKCELLSENEMMCFKHYTPLPLSEDEMSIGMSENGAESQEVIITKLRTENEALRTEISYLKNELRQLESSINQQLEGERFEKTNTSDSDTKSLVDELKNELFHHFTKFKNEINKTIEHKFSEIHSITENLQAKPKFSDIVKKQDVVIIKPKTNQTSKVTLESIQQTIDPVAEDIGVNHVKQLRNGGVVIGCNKKEDITKLHNISTQKLGEDYTIRKSGLRNPMIKIVGLSESYNEESLKRCITRQNSTLKDLINTWKLVICKKMKKKYMAIVEVDPKSFLEFIKLKTVLIHWDECRIFEHFGIIRCYNCGGYNHTAKYCKEGTKICLNCDSREHVEIECEKGETSCINCIRANKNLKLDLDINHSRFDPKCEVLKKQVQRAQAKTKYNNI